jgi:hypothetical protein
MLIDWYLTPTSAVFQPYRDIQLIPVKPAHTVTSIKAVTCFKSHLFSCPVI